MNGALKHTPPHNWMNLRISVEKSRDLKGARFVSAYLERGKKISKKFSFSCGYLRK